MDDEEAKPVILIVDDEPVSRLRLQHLLERNGCETILACDGQEALYRIEQNDIDVVLTDISMPNLDGIGLIKKIRESHDMIELPVIAMTCSVGQAELLEAFEVHANDYVRKPVDNDVVLARLRTQITIKQTNRQLKKSQAQYRLAARALDEASCGISISDVSDPELPLIYVNEAFEKISGYSKDEVLGKSCRYLQGNETLQPALRKLRNTMKDGGACKVELRNYRKDGTMFWNQLSLSPIRDQKERLTHYLCIQSDVTKEKDAFEALQQKTEELIEANKKLALEIQHRKEAEEEKDQLTAELIKASHQAGMAEVATGVLHNVGNVMNSINTSVMSMLGMFSKSRISQLPRLIELVTNENNSVARLLGEDEQGRQFIAYLEKLAEYLEEESSMGVSEADSLKENVNHVCEIIAMQQSFSRLGGVVEEFCLNQLCEDAIKINDAGLMRHGIDLATDFHELPPINNEKHKILQILVNFVSNAKYSVSASRKSVKEISLKTYRIGDQFVVEVADNGIGIDGEIRGKIFQHGFTTKSEGHGFGLHSCINSAREIGGDITFDSPGVNQGATFRLLLKSVTSNAGPDSAQHFEANEENGSLGIPVPLVGQNSLLNLPNNAQPG